MSDSRNRAAKILLAVVLTFTVLMIGWSASFTYLAMARFWPMHGERVLPFAQAGKPSGRNEARPGDGARGL